MEKLKVPVIIAALSVLQIIHGQIGNLANNPPGPQNLNQGFPTPLKNANENLQQNENFGKGSNFNTPGQFNMQQPQPLATLPQSFPLQQIPNLQQNLQQQLPQNFPQVINQPNQLSELQVPILYQPLNMPQPPLLQQPILQDTSTQFFPIVQQATVQPFNPKGNINYPQIPVGTMMQKNPVQIAQILPSSNSFVSPYSSISSMSPYGCQRTEFMPNLEGNYARQYITVPFSVPETQVIKSFPVPYQTVLPPSNPRVLAKSPTPYQNQVYSVVRSPLDLQNNISTDEDLLETDNLTTLLLSLLQSTKTSNQPQYYSPYPYTPYGPYNTNVAPKSSSLKSLMPLIFDMIKEKREGCGCNENCNGCRKKKLNKNLDNQVNGNYSKKKNYNLRDEMFRDNNSDEDTPRIAREHKKCKRLKSSAPLESFESRENEERDYDEFSEEQE